MTDHDANCHQPSEQAVLPIALDGDAQVPNSEPKIPSKLNGSPSHKGWLLTEREREVFRVRSRSSREAKARAVRGDGEAPLHPINTPRFEPNDLMPQRASNRLRSLSLFSGGGGLDLAFLRAGFNHVASYEILPEAAKTLRRNRPDWVVHGGVDGDVRAIDWNKLNGSVDIIHGGPPCQPFSAAGRQHGAHDARDMFPEFVRAVLAIEPLAFVAENVQALTTSKFQRYVRETIEEPLGHKYTLARVQLSADAFGVPQIRKRVFFVGFRNPEHAARYQPPTPTHDAAHLSAPTSNGPQAQMFPSQGSRIPCMGVREALGLPPNGYDALAPTLRSALTGPRHTTSILSSVSAQRAWNLLHIWPNGVAPSRVHAHRFVAPNGHFRLSVPDCALLQGFPEDWEIEGAVYMSLGQIGNAVPPPLGYQVARSIELAITQG